MRPAPLLALLVLAAPAAHATQCWTSDDGERVLELQGFYKSLALGLNLPDPLVATTADLARAVEEARALLPVDQRGSLPAIPAIPDVAGVSTHTARVAGRLVLGDRWELGAAYQLSLSLASDRAFVGSGGIGGLGTSGSNVVGGSAQAAKRRLADLSPILVDEGGLRLVQDLGVLFARVKLGHTELVVGRQILSWGSGRFWNPTDLLSPFAPTDVDREVRRGVDAVRWSRPIGEEGLLDVLWLPQQELADNGAVVRAQVNVKRWDVGLSVAKYARDLVGGLELSGDLGPFAAHAEGAYTAALINLGQHPGFGEKFFRGVVGGDWKPTEDLLVSLEYLYDGFGTTDPAAYARVLRSDRVLRGEVFGAGRHRAGLALAWAASDLVSASLVVLANLTDPGVLVLPVVEWWAEQSVLVRVGAYLPIASAPTRIARDLTGADVLNESAAFRLATSTLGLTSEYGTTPLGLFVQLGISR